MLVFALVVAASNFTASSALPAFLSSAASNTSLAFVTSFSISNRSNLIAASSSAKSLLSFAA